MTRSDPPEITPDHREAPHPLAHETHVHQIKGDGPPPAPPSKWVLLLVLLGAGGLLGYGGYKHWSLDAEAAATQQETIDFVPSVRTIAAQAESKPVKLILPGETDSFDYANIYPRATGYIAERRADIGSRVKQGDLLVKIASPDTDAQLDQARAQLKQVQATIAQAQASIDQAKANLSLGRLNFKRSDDLVQRGFDTQQNNDQQRTNVTAQQASLETAEAGLKVAQANEQAQQATVARLETLTKFEEVRAPFDGIVTTRNVDTGDLVNADSKTGMALFTMAKDSVIRVTIHVPQANAIAIHDGLPAAINVPQIPDRTFTGKIARSSVALQTSSRTLTTQVDVQNPDGALRPGLFVNVTFDVPRIHPNIVLPAEALIFNAQGLQVAIVQGDQVHMQPIAIYRDFGKTVELRDGLRGGENVVLSPPANLEEGSKVKVEPSKPQQEAQK